MSELRPRRPAIVALGVTLGALGIVALALGLGAAGVARGELTQEGNLLLAFDGGISPPALPREELAPVAVWVDSTIKTTDGSDPPPQLQEIAIAINKGGRLFNRGLPTCRVRRIQPSTLAMAKKICGGAIVGRGHVGVRIALGSEPPFDFKAPLLAFNAEPHRGKRRILAQVYGRRPPSAFVLTFTIRKRPGTFGTVISTKLPHSTRRWAYITHFDMRLQRRFVYRGEKRSFVSASCAAPQGFPGTVYPFAEANYKFAGGTTASATLLRNCRVRS
jgi:hypothetical protein